MTSLSFIKTPLLEVAYEVSGPETGDPVILLHGWPDAARSWRPIAAKLNAAGFRTFAPSLRGSGKTRFLAESTIRDGSGVAITQDIVEFADALGLTKFNVAGQDWGGRVTYTLGSLFPERLKRMAVLGIPFQPTGVFRLTKSFPQAQRFWYQWYMCLEGGPEAIAADPKGFARMQWDTWSPAGWYEPAEFDETALDFENSDWLAITLNAYRHRWRSDEILDTGYDGLRERLKTVEAIRVPTLMVQGGADGCDQPSATANQAQYFLDGYERIVLDGVGHFPSREAPSAVADAMIKHLGS